MCYSVPVDRAVRVLHLVSPLKAAKCCMCLFGLHVQCLFASSALCCGW